MKYGYYVGVEYEGAGKSARKDKIIRSVAKELRGRVTLKGVSRWRFGIKKGKSWIRYEVDFYTEREANRFKNKMDRLKGFSTSSVMW